MGIPLKSSIKKPPLPPIAPHQGLPSSAAYSAETSELLAASDDIACKDFLSSDFSHEDRNPLALAKTRCVSSRDHVGPDSKHKQPHTVRFASMPVRRTYPIEDIDLTQMNEESRTEFALSVPILPQEYAFPKNFKGIKLDEQDDSWPEEEPKRKSKWRKCGMWCCFILILFSIIIGVAALVFHMTVKTKAPTFGLENLNLISFAFTDRNAEQEAILELALNVTFKVHNANAVARLVYKSATLLLFYDSQVIGSVILPAFAQHSKGDRYVNASLPTTTTRIQDSELSMRLAQDVTDLNVHVALIGPVNGHYRIFGMFQYRFTVPINCAINFQPQHGSEAPKFIIASCYVRP